MPWFTPQESTAPLAGFQEESQLPAADAMGAAVAQSFGSTLPMLAYEAGKRVAASREDPTPLTKDAAQKRAEEFGVQVHIPDDGVSEGALNVMIARQQRRAHRAAQMEAGNIPGLPEQTIAGFVGGLPDPVNLLFLPFGPEEAVGRLGLEALAKRAAFGAAEGAGVTAAAEPAYNLLSNAAGDDYGMGDSLVNIAFGAVLGGAAHLGGALLHNAAETRTAGRKALQDVIADRPVNVDREVQSVLQGPEATDRARTTWASISDFADRMAAEEPHNRPAWENIGLEARNVLSGPPETAADHARLAEIGAQIDALHAENTLTAGAADLARASEPSPVSAEQPGLSPTHVTPEVTAEIQNVDRTAAQETLKPAPQKNLAEPSPDLVERTNQDIADAKTEAATLDREDPLKRDLATAEEHVQETNQFADAFSAALQCALRKGTP